MNSPGDDTEREPRPSKSQRKRDMDALQVLGGELVGLSADQLARIELPERLFEAVVEAQRISSFEGRRRQLQYIGKVMRDVDAAPIRARLDACKGRASEDTAQQRLIERWRERLLAEESALAEFAAAHAGCDLQNLRSLIASVRRDRAENRPTKQYRMLFRAIRDVIAGKAEHGNE